jgi:hypothetical protein
MGEWPGLREDLEQPQEGFDLDWYCCFGKPEGVWSGIDVEDVPVSVHRYMYTLRLYGHI